MWGIFLNMDLSSPYVIYDNKVHSFLVFRQLLFNTPGSTLCLILNSVVGKWLFETDLTHLPEMYYSKLFYLVL